MLSQVSTCFTHLCGNVSSISMTDFPVNVSSGFHEKGNEGRYIFIVHLVVISYSFVFSIACIVYFGLNTLFSIRMLNAYPAKFEYVDRGSEKMTSASYKSGFIPTSSNKCVKSSARFRFSLSSVVPVSPSSSSFSSSSSSSSTGDACFDDDVNDDDVNDSNAKSHFVGRRRNPLWGRRPDDDDDDDDDAFDDVVFKVSVVVIASSFSSYSHDDTTTLFFVVRPEPTLEGRADPNP